MLCHFCGSDGNYLQRAASSSRLAGVLVVVGTVIRTVGSSSLALFGGWDGDEKLVLLKVFFWSFLALLKAFFF